MNSRFRAVIAEVLGLRESDVRIDLTKEDTGSWDSLKQLDLVMSIEREFGVELEIADIVQMDSIAKIIDVLNAKGVTLAD